MCGFFFVDLFVCVFELCDVVMFDLVINLCDLDLLVDVVVMIVLLGDGVVLFYDLVCVSEV